MKRAALPLLLLLATALAAPMGPMRHEFRFRWGWGDVVLASVAAMTLVFGALLANYVLLGAALAAIVLTALMIEANSPQWWRGVLAFALLLLSFYVLFG